MRKLLIGFFISINISAGPWLDEEDIVLNFKIADLEKQCNIKILDNYDTPYSIGVISKRIDLYIKIAPIVKIVKIQLKV